MTRLSPDLQPGCKLPPLVFSPNLPVPQLPCSPSHHQQPDTQVLSWGASLPLGCYFSTFYLFMAFWVSVAACRLSLVAAGGGYSLAAVHRLLTVVASLVAEHRLKTHRLSCSEACGLIPDQGSNQHPPHWQADSYSLYHQGSPKVNF